MAVSLNVKIDHTSKEIDKALKSLENNDEMHKVMVDTANRTGFWFRNQVLRGLGKSLGITKPIDKLKKRTRSKRTRNHNSAFQGDIYLKPIALHDVVPSNRITPTPNRRKRLRKEPGFSYKGTTYAGSWLASGKNSGKPIVIQRKGSARYPTKSVTIPETEAATLSVVRGLKSKLDKRFLMILRRDVRRRVFQRLNR